MAKKKIGYVELQWKCPNCGGIIPGSKRSCGNCGAPQPEDVQFFQGSGRELITSEETVKEASAGADIHCPFCGTRNPAEAKICQQCGGDLVEGTKRESGRVVGAYLPGGATTIKCPRCGSENPATALACANCGGSLQEEPAGAKIQETTKKPARTNPWLIVGIVAVVVLICSAIGILLFFARKTDAATGVVQGVYWARSIPIEALVPVEYQGWKDEIPQDAMVQNCSDKVRSVEDQPVQNSLEVCGTPYTVETGSGYGEVVQDCEYQVYDSYCSYSLQEWRPVENASISGSDHSPIWPEPVLEQGQRLGQDRSETYTIVFIADGQSYKYNTSDINLFQQAQIGSQWKLKVNTFGQVVSIEP